MRKHHQFWKAAALCYLLAACAAAWSIPELSFSAGNVQAWNVVFFPLGIGLSLCGAFLIAFSPLSDRRWFRVVVIPGIAASILLAGSRTAILSGTQTPPIVGDTPPPFAAVATFNTESEVLQHDSLQVVYFWHPRCGPCIESFPLLESYQQVLKDRGVEFTTVALFRSDARFDAEPDSQLQRIESIIQKRKVDFPVLVVDAAIPSRFYGVTAYPTVLLFSATGEVIDIAQGTDGTKRIVRRAFFLATRRAA